MSLPLKYAFSLILGGFGLFGLIHEFRESFRDIAKKTRAFYEMVIRQLCHSPAFEKCKVFIEGFVMLAILFGIILNSSFGYRIIHTLCGH